MTYQPFYISSFESESGLDQYYESFLIPEKAFPTLEDAYCWRGRVRRRQGFNLLGRLRRFLEDYSLPNTPVGSPYTVADVLSALRTTEPNAEIQIGNFQLVIDVGTANETIYNDATTPGILTHVSGLYTGAGTINYITGTIRVNFIVTPAAGDVVQANFGYYPALPVMGLRTREIRNTVDDEQLIAFDTKYAYRFLAGFFEELPAVTPTSWNGTDSQFFWTTNYYNTGTGDLFWATNNNATGLSPDPIRYYDGNNWTDFEPAIDATNFLEQCLLLIPYKNRLLAINTWEGTAMGSAANFPQRIRFSQNGTPTDQTNGWLDNVIGRGGFIDVPTNETITSVEFLKDVLVLKCERSSWKVIYTGNETLPFIVQKINAELGAESTFSLVPFDRGVYAVANVGITTDDSINVFRIDQKIPQIVFNINNDNQGVQRVYGIRDYGQELVYWTFPNSAQNPNYPNRVLVYNYINSTYAIFNDSFTCYGYYQRTSDLIWSTLPFESWESWIEPWDSGVTQSLYPDVVAGNQQGFVEILNQGVYNAPSLAITGITSGTPVTLIVPNHNLQTGQFVEVTGIQGISPNNPDTLNNVIYRVQRASASQIFLQLYNPTTGIFDNVTLDVGGTYLGGGTLTVLNNINITTKRFSPFYDQGDQCRLGYLDFFLAKTSNGQVSINLYVDENNSISINDPSSFSNNGLLGDNVIFTKPENLTLIPFQANQQKIWHRMYAYAIAQNFQLQIFMDDAQMSDKDINSSDFIMHAMAFYLSPNARLVQ